MGYKHKKYKMGLVTKFPHEFNCDRCSLPLRDTNNEHHTIVVSTNSKAMSGFICLKCYAIIKLKKYQREKLKPEVINECIQKIYQDFEKTLITN